VSNSLLLDLNGSKAVRIQCTLFSPSENQRRVVTLIYDTGSDKTTITRATLESLGYKDFLEGNREVYTSRGKEKPRICKISKLVIGGKFTLDDITVDVMDVKDYPINGLIGMDFITSCENIISGNKKRLSIKKNY